MHVEATARQRVTVTVNGEAYEREVDVRMLLADFLRREWAAMPSDLAEAESVRHDDLRESFHTTPAAFP